MGGLGSGRHGGGPTVESSLTLDIDKLRRDDLIAPGLYRRLTLTWSWSGSGERIADIVAVVDTHETGGSLRLQFVSRNPATGGRSETDQPIRLTTIEQPFGGRRWFALCPFTGARCSKLIMPPGATKFAARGAWRRLAYKVQREAPYDQALRRAFKLRARLGDHRGGIGDPIRKPRWMRRRTYERQIAEIERAEAQVESYLAAFLDRLRSRDPGLRI